ncbi:anion transporter [bacterium]|nr:anion transporter [bacterium]
MPLVLAVFAVVYLGMLVGGVPGTGLDRTGVALLGAIALVAGGALGAAAAWQAVDVATIALLFALMVVSGQLAQAGFYAALTARITTAALSPPLLLAILVLSAGLLSAVLVNDVVCLAMAPIVVAGCAGRRLDPRPFLLALAAAANVGSAATLIGNPQNILIGQVLRLSFAGYLADAAVPALLGLGVVWWVIARQSGGRWQGAEPSRAIAVPRLDVWQSGKGLAVLAALIVGFVAGVGERDVLALAGAAVLLVSRRTASRGLLAQVDGQLLLLFVALFIVNHAVAASGLLAVLRDRLAAGMVDLQRPGWLFAVTVALSNLVSNVPAVMLLLPLANGEQAGAILGLASTLAGNLLLVGSIANLIVVDQADRLGIAIGWREHARAGVPITVLTSALAIAWLWWRSGPG